MSYQVGPFCYATVQDAAGAACARFDPASSVLSDGSGFRSASCSGVNSTTGALQISLASTTPAGATTYATIEQQIAFAPCQETDYLTAYQSLFGIALGAIFICYGLWRVYRFITNNSRVPE